MRTSRSVVRSSDLGCLVSGFCSSGRGFAPRFLQTPPRGDALALRSHFTSIRLCRGLAPPGCRTCSAHGKPAGRPEARKVSTSLVANSTLALQGMTLLEGDVEAPCLIDGPGPFDASEVVPTRNSLLYLPEAIRIHPLHYNGTAPPDQSRAVAEPTPRFFCPYALDFDFRLDAPLPVEWLKFLASLWGGDG